MALIGAYSGFNARSRIATTQTASWAGNARRMVFKPAVFNGLVTNGIRPGVQIVSAGQYRLSFNFTISGIGTGIRVRTNSVGGTGPTPAVIFTADGSGCYSSFSNVTASDLLAGSVYLVVEVASTEAVSESIVWEHAEVMVERIGADK